MTCSVFSCCDGSHRTTIPVASRQNRQKPRERGVVLLLASSDVLHAIRSKSIDVVLIDVRNPDQYHSSHIKDAMNFPCGLLSPPSYEDILNDSALHESLRKATPGALSDLLRSEKPTGSEVSSSANLGTCIVVYDSIGDTKDLPGPAAVLAQLLIEKDLVREVGRLAGGFQAFKELNACVESGSQRTSSSGCSVESLSGRQSSTEPHDAASRLSRAATPPAGITRVSSGSAGSRRSTTRWAVTISAPQEVGPAEVVKGRLFLGNKNHANDRETLRQLRISHVINVSRDYCTPFAHEGLKYCHCYVADSVTSDVSKFFEETTQFIQDAMRSGPDAAILVHCAGGVSRSSALVAAYLMRAQSMSLADALQHIRTCHPAAAPNSGFIHQLMKLEESLGVDCPREPSFQDLKAAGYSTTFPHESTPGAAGGDIGAALSAVREGGTGMTWLDYAAAPPTPAPASRASRPRTSKPWDDAPPLLLPVLGDTAAAAAAATTSNSSASVSASAAAAAGVASGGGRLAEEALEDAGPAAKRSHWDVMPEPPSAGGRRGGTPAAAMLWAADSAAPAPLASPPPASRAAVFWPEPVGGGPS